MRSLSVKLVLAFTGICLFEALLIGFLIREVQQSVFDSFVQEEAIYGFADDALSYYEIRESWEGVDRRIGHGSQIPRPPPVSQPPPVPPNVPEPAPRPPDFALADREGQVVLSNERYRRGDSVAPEILDSGTPLLYLDEHVGTVLPPSGPWTLGPREQAFLTQFDRMLLFAALGALVVAIVVAGIFSRSFLRPIQSLTTATRRLAEGEDDQPVVPVMRKDELGELSRSFNTMTEELATVKQLRRRMTADIAHDLRTPLTVLTGYLEAMRTGDLSPTKERIETMFTEVLQLDRLVKDLRLLSLADEGKLPLEKELLPPRVIVEEVATAFRETAEKNGVRLAVDVEESLGGILIDGERLGQVLSNLISNALRFTDSGGEIRVHGHFERERYVFEISDTGKGIPPESLPHIFERFYRVDSARSQAGESGLGLAIARSIVEAHEGTLSVKSKLGQGTTFSISLPTSETLKL